jgi:hypothetical protein
LKVSPNPFTDELSINIGAQPLTHLVITDLSGRECYRREISASDQSGGVHINAAGFPHGILMIAGYNGSGIVATQKVMRK